MSPHDPILLRPDCFTPTTRTPWGGTRIVEKYKPTLRDSSHGAPPRVGESWELSVVPGMQSQLATTGEALDIFLAHHRDILGREASALGRSGTALLLKLLDAATPLSVQVHPAHDYEALAPNQSGKPETWYILDADLGSVIYLGLKPGVTRETIERALRHNDDIASHLHAIEVQPGDFFVVLPGMPHAIGAGVTLVEPQFVAPGKEGVTYRVWDWNRRYNALGELDPAGEPRALDVAQALDVTRWDWYETAGNAPECFRRWGWPDVGGPARLERLAGEPRSSMTLPSGWLSVERMFGVGELDLAPCETLRSVTVVEGTILLPQHGNAPLRVDMGTTALVPATSSPCRADLRYAHAIIAHVLA